jgi:hypothetical protein
LNGVVFVLGAGASVDAGMPTVVQLTEELRHRLRTLADINGHVRPEFTALFDKIVSWDPNVSSNYEALFEWIALQVKAEKAPYRNAFEVRLPKGLAGVPGELAFVIKRPVLEVLRERHRAQTYDPRYLQRLKDFVPEHGRLKVFTLNYDLCVEDACRNAGVELATGFSRSEGKWTPSLFQDPSSGINLYKLHGSLNWGLRLHGDGRLRETWPTDWSQEGEFLLGPGPKLQHDDPFVTLYAEFHQSMRAAKICVIIGCRLADEHIRDPIKEANRGGMTVVEVNPSGAGIYFERCERLQKTAREALESNLLRQVLEGLAS